MIITRYEWYNKTCAINIKSISLGFQAPIIYIYTRRQNRPSNLTHIVNLKIIKINYDLLVYSVWFGYIKQRNYYYYYSNVCCWIEPFKFLVFRNSNTVPEGKLFSKTRDNLFNPDLLTFIMSFGSCVVKCVCLCMYVVQKKKQFYASHFC